jgi:hypothetical protein
MRWLVPALALLCFASAVSAGLIVLNYSSVSEMGDIQLLAGTAFFVICGLLLLNIVLALKDIHRR